MRRQYRKYALWGAAFAVLITLGAATAAFTAGAAPKPSTPASTVQKQARPAAATKVKKVAQPRPSPARPRVKPSRPRPRTSKPKVQKRVLPWRPDGMSEVAHVRVRRIAVYRSRQAKH